MKVYTFKAPDSTRVEVLWSLRPKNRDKIFDKYIQENSYTEVDYIENCQIAIYPQRVFQPETLVLDNGVYDAAIAAQKHNKPLIIDATCDSDVFLNIPTAQILRCGLYRSIKRSFETECPFWSNYRTKKALDLIELNSAKGSRPAIGFCGTTASRGKLSNLTKNQVPIAIAKSVFSNSQIARQIDIRVKEGMSLKLREAAINLLKSDRRLDTYFDITNNYQSYYHKHEQNRILLEKLFVKNISQCDYVLCVRGTGNYSGRFYMALNAGRIPVVLDTDVVIPFENLLHLIKIPLNSLNKIGDIISEHFENTSEQDLKYMKIQNREIFNRFLTPERFFKSFIDSIVC